MAKRYELSDEAWTVVADLFTEALGRGRPRLSDRLMLDGVLWVLCSGAAWRDMPERFGPWSTVYQRFRGWRNQGTFDQMLKRLHLRLNEQGLIDLQTWMIDSTAVRSTRAFSGAGKKGGMTSILEGSRKKPLVNRRPMMFVMGGLLSNLPAFIYGGLGLAIPGDFLGRTSWRRAGGLEL
jgi:Transposase and inactivated derivatives